MRSARGLAAATATAAAVAWLAWPRMDDGAPRGCPVGARAYDLTLGFTQRTTLPGGDGTPLTSRVTLDGPVTVEHAWERGRCLASLRLDAATAATASAQLADRELLDASARAALGAHDVIAEVEDGVPAQLHLPAGAPVVVRNVLTLVATELGLRAHPPAEAIEPAYAGTARVRYVVRPAGDAREVVRERLAFAPLRLAGGELDAPPEVRSTTRGVVGADGALTRLDHVETIAVSATSTPRLELDTRLVLVARGGRGRGPGGLRARLAGREVVAPGGEVADPEAAARARASRIAGLTGAELMSLVRAVSDDRFPDELRLVWRATALLAAEPALLDALGVLYADDALSDAGRRLVLDLLAGTDHPRAQRVLTQVIAAITDPAARADALTRFAVVEHATAASVAFLIAELDAARDGAPEVANAALYMVGAAAASTDDDAARAAAEAVIARALDDAGDAAARGHALAAIHNAGSAALIERAAPLAGSDDWRDRAGVARAVRKLPGARSLELVRPLVTDPSPRVQRLALETLHTQPITADDIAEIATLVIGDRIAPGAYASAVPLLRLAPPGLRRQAANAMLAHLDGADPTLVQQVLALLEA